MKLTLTQECMIFFGKVATVESNRSMCAQCEQTNKKKNKEPKKTKTKNEDQRISMKIKIKREKGEE